MLVLPALLEQVLAISVGFTDKWLAGNLLEGPAFLAAVGLVGYALGFLPGLFAVPAVAATALVARCVGGGISSGPGGLPVRRLSSGVCWSESWGWRPLWEGGGS